MTTRKLPLVLLLMMVIFSAGSLIQLQPVSATFPGANGKIVFTRYVGAVAPQTQIFTMNPDGSGLTQLTFSGDNAWPRWSADGSKIVFQNFPTYAIWIMNADGSNPIDITNSANDFAPNWQPLFANPVGGVVMPTSKLEIVAPFAALTGLVVAVSAVVAVKKRRD